MNTVWTYEGYWNTVLGANRSADQVVFEFGLAGDPFSLEEWLDSAEVAAWQAGGEGGKPPAEWAEHHARALTALAESIAS